MSELSDKVLERIYKEALADVDKKATYIKALEKELEQSDEQVQMQLIELQKLKEGIELLRFWEQATIELSSPTQIRIYQMRVDELLNQSK